jgi:hypothetical protein
MSKRKYRPGKRIENMTELDICLREGKYIYLFHNGRPIHSGFVVSMMYKTVSEYVYRGKVYLAEKIDKE